MQSFLSHSAVVVMLAVVPFSSSAQDARALVEQGKFAQAEASLQQILSTHPSDAEAHYLLAYVLLRKNLPKESLAEYTRSARLRPPAAGDLKNVALAYVLLNDYQQAEKWTLRSLEMNKQDADAWYTLGRIRYSTGKLSSARECFEHALALAPRSVKAETNLGLAYEGLNQLEKAKQAYQAAIEMQKDASDPSPQPLIDLAIVLLHHGDLAAALGLLKQAVAIAPNDPRVHEQMGLVFTEQGALTDAQAQFETAIALSPVDARLHFLLGRVYRREGMTQKAQEEFARTAALNGTHSTPKE